MLECLILGDSIAVGTHQFRKECVAHARGGWNSWQWNKEYLQNNLSAKTVIISLGSNDHGGIKTKQELEKMRAKIVADRVFWILPGGVHPRNSKTIDEVQSDVFSVAKRYNDTVLPIPSFAKEVIEGKSVTIHPDPAGYREIAKKTK